MKKQQKQMFILLVMLVALIAVSIGVKQYNKAQAEKPAEEKEQIIVIDAVAEEVTQLTYDYDGESYTFEKEDDVWYAAEDHSLSILQIRLTSMVGAVTPLEASQKIENVTDLAQYGLAEPQQTITVETAAKSYILYVGDQNELTSSYYVCLPSTTTVYTVSTTDISRFNYALADLIEEEEEESADEASGNTEGMESADGTSESAENAESADGTSESAESTESADGTSENAENAESADEASGNAEESGIAVE